MRRLSALVFAVSVLIASGVFVVQAQMSSPQEEGGVTWPLTATGDLDMSSNNILDVGYLESDNADVADAGVIRLGDGEAIGWEYAAGSDNSLTCTAAACALALNGATEVDFTAAYTRFSNEVQPTGAVDFVSTSDIFSNVNGQIGLADGARTTGIVLDANDAADTLIVKDLAGTGVGNVGVDTNGSVCLNGSTCTTKIYSDGTYTYITANATNPLRIASAATYFGSSFNISTTINGYYRVTGTSCDAAGELCGEFEVFGTGAHQYSTMGTSVADATGADEDGDWVLQVSNDGSLVDVIRADMDDAVETVEFDFPIVVPTFTHHIDIPAGAATLGPTSPTLTLQDTFLALEFDAVGEIAGGSPEVPDCWTGTSDLTLEMYWASEAGDAVADTETVKWDCDYRAIDWGNSEATDNGTVVSITATYTQSGAGTDSDTHKTSLTIDYDSATQPITAGDTIGFWCNRDTTTDTYSGAALLIRFELKLDCNTIPNY